MKTNIKFYLVLITIVSVSLACSLSAPTPSAWNATPSAEARNKTQTVFSSTRSAELTAMPTLQPTWTVTSLPRPATVQPTTVNTGPWFLYPGADGKTLHAFNTSSGTDRQVEIPPLVNLTDLSSGLSPDGSMLLLRAGRVENLDELALYRLENPLEPAYPLSPLLSLYLQREIVADNDKIALQALLGVQQDFGVAWTEDGLYAAYTAAQEGNSSNIHLYDPALAVTERMTVRVRQNLTPIWSPDNAWLVFQEAVTITPDSTWKVTAVSDVSMPDYNITRFLYMPPVESLGDLMIGWLNDSIFLSCSRDADTLFALRQVDLVKEKDTLVFSGRFSALAFDRINKHVVINITQEDALVNHMESGIYLSTTGGSPFTQILTGDYSDLVWAEDAGMFLAAGHLGVTGFNAQSTLISLPGETNLVFSPGKNWLVGWNKSIPGIRLYTAQGNLLQGVSDLLVNDVFWQPDSKGFLLTNEEGLYQVRFPLLSPNLITNDFYQGSDLHINWFQ